VVIGVIGADRNGVLGEHPAGREPEALIDALAIG
jgi:hypothetical protein